VMAHISVGKDDQSPRSDQDIISVGLPGDTHGGQQAKHERIPPAVQAAIHNSWLEAFSKEHATVSRQIKSLRLDQTVVPEGHTGDAALDEMNHERATALQGWQSAKMSGDKPVHKLKQQPFKQGTSQQAEQQHLPPAVRATIHKDWVTAVHTQHQTSEAYAKIAKKTIVKARVADAQHYRKAVQVEATVPPRRKVQTKVEMKSKNESAKPCKKKATESLQKDSAQPHQKETPKEGWNRAGFEWHKAKKSVDKVLKSVLKPTWLLNGDINRDDTRIANDSEPRQHSKVPVKPQHSLAIPCYNPLAVLPLTILLIVSSIFMGQ